MIAPPRIPPHVDVRKEDSTIENASMYLEVPFSVIWPIAVWPILGFVVGIALAIALPYLGLLRSRPKKPQPMMYSAEERLAQLDKLIQCLESLIEHLPNAPRYVNSIDSFKTYVDAVRELRSNGYIQSDLNSVSRGFPAIINLHPHWDVPFPANEYGHVEIPDWYNELDRLHSACERAAWDLRVIGTYSESNAT